MIAGLSAVVQQHGEWWIGWVEEVPGVNSQSEGGDRVKQLAGTTTDPNNPDTDGDGIPDGIEDANHNGWVDGDGEPLPARARIGLAGVVFLNRRAG